MISEGIGAAIAEALAGAGAVAGGYAAASRKSDHGGVRCGVSAMALALGGSGVGG